MLVKSTPAEHQQGKVETIDRIEAAAAANKHRVSIQSNMKKKKPFKAEAKTSWIWLFTIVCVRDVKQWFSTFFIMRHT